MIVILLLLFLIGIGVSVWALADIASKPEAAFVGAGMSKFMWVVLIAVFIVVFAPVAVVLSVVYLASVRSKLVKEV
jgi:hypothetical protein